MQPHNIESNIRTLRFWALPLWCVLLCLPVTNAVGNSPATPPLNAWLTYELLHTNSIQGYNTYRVFLNVNDPASELISIYGVVDNSSNAPLSITTDGLFFQQPLGGLVASDINPAVFPILPELEFDSWLTIGIEPGAGIIYKLGFEANAFDEDGLIIDDQVGAVVYTLPGLLPEAVAGPDGKILIGQFTISGTAYLNMNFQLLHNSVSTYVEQLYLEFPTPYAGCSESIACNYDPLADNDPQLCTYPTCNDLTACNFNPTGECFNQSVCILPDGCTNPIACNYDPDALCDDATCILPDGCTDPSAENFNPVALCDDGTCLYDIFGCTDPDACDYIPEATVDDGSCGYPDPFYDCFGNCLELDGCGNCGGSDYAGCTNPNACNYDADAGCDDGSCILVFGAIEGCTDPTAINFMAAANTDDGSCIFAGCTDTNADNYSASALFDDGSCTVNGQPLVYGCTDDMAMNYSPGANVDIGCLFASSVQGCTDLTAINYMPAATADDGSCIFAGCTDTNADNYSTSASFDDGSCTINGQPLVYGCTDDSALNYAPSANVDLGCVFDSSVQGCTDLTAINYMPAATTDDGSCIFAGCTDANADNYTATAVYDDGSCTLNGDALVYGCTDGNALNFEALANVNTGCVYALPVPGCTDPIATNYMPAATVDDGSCNYSSGGPTSCTGDLNIDGVVNASDLTIFLSVFNTICP